MLNNQTWFTESNTSWGTGFSLQIKAKICEEQSPYQKIAIYETTHFGYLMTIDDIIMLSTCDNFLYHEMLSHPVLFTHPNPKNVVIIGGGDCGTLKEVLKHSIDSVVQIDIDEKVTRLAEKYFPELCAANHDPRATLLFQDGIRWMQEAQTGSIDIIIVDSTDPIGPAEGLFNQAFYEQCYRVLREEGLLVQQSESPLIHQQLLKDMRAAMKNADFADLLTITFPQPVYPSGWWSATIAGKKVLPHFRKDTATFSKLATKYYHFAIHEAALTPIPMLQQVLGIV